MTVLARDHHIAHVSMHPAHPGSFHFRTIQVYSSGKVPYVFDDDIEYPSRLSSASRRGCRAHTRASRVRPVSFKGMMVPRICLPTHRGLPTYRDQSGDLHHVRRPSSPVTNPNTKELRAIDRTRAGRVENAVTVGLSVDDEKQRKPRPSYFKLFASSEPVAVFVPLPGTRCSLTGLPISAGSYLMVPVGLRPWSLKDRFWNCVTEEPEKGRVHLFFVVRARPSFEASCDDAPNLPDPVSPLQLNSQRSDATSTHPTSHRLTDKMVWTACGHAAMHAWRSSAAVVCGSVSGAKIRIRS
nr:hypothetical protein CFP56_32439 [Quercus suber]